MLEIRGLKYSYAKERVIQYPEFMVSNGEILRVNGPSGSGKSTLLQLLAGLITGYSGDIFFAGRAYSDYKKPLFKSGKLGYVAQTPLLLKNMPINFSFGLDNWKLKTSEDREWIAEMITIFKMEKELNKYPDELSLGQAMRAQIISVFANAHRLLLLDEPTASLDDDNVEGFMQLLKLYQSKFNPVVVMVSHDNRVRGYSNSIEL
ncbi:ATP-binding cassette domain-containing protein [Luteibaculum oceani]|uniref:ATP-binding cassette domain-containing protein n=1 Tax=Luteibaculum oceani TaxID=1294296 RepID=A0A5C6UZ67_9FLAO|nr:ATP-binding cassette domain-containing protein [Luteibaculum oceani]TXC78557.1 ATP-binding cassette domain-containing protein [Luteibaculum oceani]